MSSKQLEQVRDAAFHALGNQFRRTLLVHLAADEQTIGELADAFPEEATTLAYHLRALRKARLIKTLPGLSRRTTYQVSPKAIADLKRVLAEAQPEIEAHQIEPCQEASPSARPSV